MQELNHPSSVARVTTTLFALLAIVSSVLFYQGFTAKSVSASGSHYQTHVIYQETNSIRPNSTAAFACQKSTANPRCYAPTQIRKAYDIQRVLDAGFTGKGSTIVIVDAYQSPTIVKDLAFFNQTFKLPTASLKIIAPNGLTPFDAKNPNQINWSAEISLDVEWAHAVAPSANIDLVLAKSSSDADIFNALKYAVDKQLGGIISQSFGEAESCIDSKLLVKEHALYAQAAKEHITVFASSGDTGAAQQTCNGSSYFLSASYPASDPAVTAVGGTSLNADATTGKYIGETAWNEPKYQGASGGGYSKFFARPSFQSGIKTGTYKGRGVPDIAYNAALNGGVLVAWGVPNGVGHVYIFGGSSAGSPQWAGIIALVDQFVKRNEGPINNILYKVFGSEPSVFYHDILIGNNTVTETDSHNKSVTIHGYNTQKGWDAVTGLGTLIVGNSFFGPPKNSISSDQTVSIW